MVTTVTKTIGVGGDYTTLQAWEDAAPADLVAVDQIWRGEIKSASDGFTGLTTISGTTTDATRYKHLTAAAGASFIDNASAQTNALRFNKSNGCWIQYSGGYNITVYASEAYFRISRIQIDGQYNNQIPLVNNGGGGDINQMIVAGGEQNRGAIWCEGGTVRNTLVQSSTTNTAGGVTGSRNTLVNLTVVNISGTSRPYGIVHFYTPLTIIKNCAVFGFTAFENTAAPATITTCVTDIASPPTGCTTAPYSTATFANITSGSEDFKPATGSALLNAGTTDSTYAATDIVGTARPQGASYDVGAWELVASGGSTNTPVNPAVGTLTITGYAPTIARTANQSIAPAAGALAVSGYAPTVARTANQALTAGGGTLALTGYAPSVAQSSGTAVAPGVGSLALTGYAPTITQPQGVAPGVGSLSITGYAPSVTQGITTNIAPGAGTLAISGYAPTVVQSANQAISPGVGTLAITGYAPSLAQTANQSVLPAVGSLTITGYAPSVSQAAASPSLTPDAGLLTITGYAPSITQSAPITKIGGDDVPREDDERIEIWEPRKLQPKRDDSLDKVVREAYAKATGKPIAETIAKPGPSVRAPAPEPDPFDYEEDDLEVLMLSY